MIFPTGFLLACGPLIIVMAGWIRLLMSGRQEWPSAAGWAALGTASANSVFSAAAYWYFHNRPSLPPWKDPVTLTFSALLIPALIGMLLGLNAAARKSPLWLVVVVEIASLPLLVLSAFAVGSV